MRRRDFITISSLATAGIASLQTVSGKSLSKEKKSNSSGKKFDDRFELNEITISELQEMMSTGKISSMQITALYLKRIGEIDKNGHAINSVIEINPDAQSIAQAMDTERRSGKVRGPLHGIPVLLKDNIDTADRMMTTAGSIALIGNIASKDASIIKKLRDAGAVVLGKTNLSEWANFRSTRSCSGWSSRGGQTKNPNILDRSPCGSSSGSGAAVAANFCVVAIGTETNGSISCPASMCGVVGIKPTVGLWSRSGIIPISATQDTAGPMARTVKDAAILLGALAGVDENDPLTKESLGRNSADYTRYLDANGLTGKRIGIDQSFLKKHEGVDVLINDALEKMKRAGATIIEIEPLTNGIQKTPSGSGPTNIGEAELAVLCYEFKDGLNRYLVNANAKVKSLKEVIDFNKQHEEQAMPYFKQEIFEMAEAKGDLKSPVYLDSVDWTNNKTRVAIHETLKKYNLDAICGPVIGPANCIDEVNGDYGVYYGSHEFAAMAGYPHITVPAGKVNGLPVGINFFSSEYNEPVLIAIAYAYEQASKNRMPPDFIPTFVI